MSKEQMNTDTLAFLRRENRKVKRILDRELRDWAPPTEEALAELRVKIGAIMNEGRTEPKK